MQRVHVITSTGLIFTYLPEPTSSRKFQLMPPLSGQKVFLFLATAGRVPYERGILLLTLVSRSDTPWTIFILLPPNRFGLGMGIVWNCDGSANEPSLAGCLTGFWRKYDTPEPRPEDILRANDAVPVINDFPRILASGQVM